MYGGYIIINFITSLLCVHIFFFFVLHFNILVSAILYVQVKAPAADIYILLHIAYIMQIHRAHDLYSGSGKICRYRNKNCVSESKRLTCDY